MRRLVLVAIVAVLSSATTRVVDAPAMHAREPSAVVLIPPLHHVRAPHAHRHRRPVVRAPVKRTERARRRPAQQSPRPYHQASAQPARLMRVTRYCATGNATASGSWPRVGDVATLSRAIPFGTRVTIDGLGTYIVRDRIGYGSDLDIFTAGPDCERVAAAFGRQLREAHIG